MEANELRIGNLVNANGVYEGEVKTFKRLNEDLSVVFFSDGSKHGIGEYLEDIKPIPLTEELLLKLGFISNPYMDRYELEGFHVYCNKTKGFLELHHRGTELKYLHRLQNLYFEVKNNELTIK
jgi:hypothetical protein